MAVCFGALASLASCGSQRQPESAIASASGAAQNRPDNRPVIVAFGDSLTAGVVEQTYPEFLQNLLDKRGFLYRVDNQGISGDTSADGVARIENVLGAHPALVILEFGGNDGLRGLPVTETYKNLQTMIEQIESAHIPLVLAGITLPPNYGAEYVQSFDAMYPKLAKKYHVPLLPFLLLNVYQHPEMMQPDGIHPDGEGNKIVARDVFALIRPLLHHG